MDLNTNEWSSYDYMLTSLREAITCIPFRILQIMLGSVNFVSLRPSNVKLFEHIPQNICVCSYHENVRLMLETLKQQERMKKVPVLKLLDLKKMKYLMKVSSHLQLAIGF